MAMDNITIRKKQLEKLDEFIHGLYQETQTFKQYGVELPDLEGLYLHIHDLIMDLLSVQSSDEFMKKIEEFHKGIAGILIIVGAGDPQDIADQLKQSHEGMSDIDVSEFLKNMKVKEDGTKPSKPSAEPTQNVDESAETSEEDERRRKKDAEELVSQLGLEKHVSKQTDVAPNPDEKDGLDDLWSKWK